MTEMPIVNIASELHEDIKPSSHQTVDSFNNNKTTTMTEMPIVNIASELHEDIKPSSHQTANPFTMTSVTGDTSLMKKNKRQKSASHDSVPKKQSKKKREIKSSTTGSFASTDPFIGKCVAFGCNTTVGVELLSDFGKNWTSDAICYHLDQTAGHIVGSVMHKSRGIGSRTKDGGMKYDVAWEFSGLGET